MRTRILGLLIAFSIVPFLSQAQLPDMNFENWNTNSLFEEPDDLFTTNLQAYIIGAPPPITKVAGTQGNAARLETSLVGNDTIFGFMLNSQTSNGRPYTGTPDSLKIRVRYNIQPGDTAGVILYFSFGGNLSGLGAIALSGSSSNFVTLSSPIFSLAPPDSMLFIATSGVIPGSWVEIDDITLTNTNQQIANNGLDNWHMVGYSDPEGWTSSNLISALFQQPMAVRQNTTDVMSGSSSLEIENTVVNIYGELDTIGYISNSDIYLGGNTSGGAYTSQPEKLSFYYKYSPMGNDSATIGVLFKKWNSGTGKSDSITANITRLPAAGSFTKMELPLNWTGLPNPDSVVIAMSAGDLQNFTGVPGSKVIFDDLMFEFGVGIATPVPAFANEVHLYPNPAGDHLYIDLSRTDLQSGQVRILNILGQPMYEGSFTTTDDPMLVNLEGYQSGTYLYEIREGEKVLTGKFIVH